MASEKKKNPRHAARCSAMQALYQWQLSGNDINDVVRDYIDDNDVSEVDVKYFKKLLRGAVEHVEEMDAVMQPHLDRDLDELNPVEQAILRIAVYEFKYLPEVPYKVVINEAVEVAKSYGASDGYKYINGVLDALAPVLRPFEVPSGK